ncbi:hypothetical protein [Spiroplasma turonicum]|uniref:Lipoprotein n=1 Tax=Spiroplasma turonicum TaxID=216946 RepID=A0A0K1P725_9MOLU|nr:hypothetical protein [Spiroplasma turonicum]AKU79994.1 hypothetical protein STURON_00748 [Spiroplasma turonicum]ALX70996.1 hypothetical protein STURO_v1c07450 [Spiroplasma turonicum]
MKKLIRTLAVLTFFATPISTVVACGNKDKSKDSDKNNGNGNEDPNNPIDPNLPNDLTELQNQMVDGASFLSKMIVSGRHENLNYNINEILSMYLTPIPTAMMMPVTYKYKDNEINFASKLEKYRSLLAPSINKINNDNYSGVFASYIMGMYNNDFYNNFLKDEYFEDSFNKTGGKGFNKKSDNELGILAGFDKDLKLSEEENRKNLSWAIQDTGALTNYLLNKGYDGSYPGDTNGTSSPKSASNDKKGGTNGSGYLYYNSVVSKGKGSYNAISSKKTIIDKLSINDTFEAANLKNNEFSSKINNMSFNKIGSMIANTAGSLNLKGYINNFSSMLDNVDESDFGAEALINATNYFTPFLVKKEDTSNTRIQLVALSLLLNVQEALKNILSNDNLKTFLIENGFNETLLNSSYSFSEAISSSQLMFPNPETAKITNIYKENLEKIDPIENLKNISDLLKEFSKFQVNLKNQELIEKFKNDFFIYKKSPFYKSYSLIIDANIFFVGSLGGIGVDGWKQLVGEKVEGGSNLLNLLSTTYNKLANIDTKEIYENISNDENFKNKNISDLTRKQKLNLIKRLGYDSSEKKYTKDSILYNSYNQLKNYDNVGVKELNELLVYLKNSTNESMKPLHEQVLQYIYDDKYWKTTGITLNATDPSELNAKMEFTLEYNGIGDAESNADLQTTKIDVPDNFNPYQTKLEHQKEFLNNEELNSQVDKNKVSGKVLGKEKLNLDDNGLINYDGKGEKYKNVKHKYKLVWQNISNSSDNPYWVIVDVKSYNENGEEFYNIY